MELSILVPKPGTWAAERIDAGSGIVTDYTVRGNYISHTPDGDADLIEVYFEGNRLGVPEMQDWQERVRHAADRLASKYPTMARGLFPRSHFEDVGTYHYGPHTFEILNVIPLAVYIGAHPADARMNPSIFKQRVPCLDCPFRKDEGGVRHGVNRAAEYMSYFISPPGATFPCHCSVTKDDPRTEWSTWQEGQVLCSGGLLFGAKLNVYNGIAALGMACGWYDPADHKPEELALVFDTIEDMLRAHDKGE